MKITIGKPFAVTDKGGRKNNEDAVYPLPEHVEPSQRLFIVCDGVGGAEKGEIASSLACESLYIYFDTFLKGDPTPEFIQKALLYTESRFDDYVDAHPEAIGMATTLTLLYLGTNGATLAHIGDSRIYHIRKGQLLHQTEDHSLVNSLVKLGQIGPEEAATHPQRNIILRAIQGSSRPTEAEVCLIKDLQAGDYLFMCTDGVMEAANNQTLASLFELTPTAEAIKDALTAVCKEKSRDNFSFYVMPIESVKETVGFKQNILSFLYSLA